MTSERASEGHGDPADSTGPLKLAAIERIFRERRDDLIRMARGFLVRHRCDSRAWGPEDAVQETMVAICKAVRAGTLPDLATDDDLFRYIRTAMARRILLATRRLRTPMHGGGYQQVEVDLDLRPAPQARDGLTAEPSEDLERLLDRIEDPSLREIVRGIRDGRTYKEIAERLGISEQTVRRRRRLLPDLLDRLRRGD